MYTTLPQANLFRLNIGAIWNEKLMSSLTRRCAAAAMVPWNPVPGWL